MDEYYRAVQALPAWLARTLSALPPDIAEQVHEIRLRVGCGVQLTIGGRPCCPAGLPALQKLDVYKRQRFDKVNKIDGNNHLILLCKNEMGYKNLIKMVSAAFVEGFYSKPRVDKQLLEPVSYTHLFWALSRVEASAAPIKERMRSTLSQLLT